MNTPPPAAARWRRRLGRILAGLLLTLAGLALALWAVLRVALLPQAGDWATEVGRGALRLPVSVSQGAWIATTPWVAARLHGRRLRTTAGPVTFGWQPPDAAALAGVLTLRCAPCTLPLPDALGQARVTVPALQLSVARQIDAQPGPWLHGTLALQPADAGALTAHWQARTQRSGWAVTLDWPQAQLADWLALLTPDLPERRSAHIQGHVAVRMSAQLPHGAWRIEPQLHGVSVAGLGTEGWASARAGCGTPVRLPPHGWLVRAVLAAEDQRFFEHPGYDLEEWLAALHTNQQHGTIRRGGSTLTQQLAKLMVTGGDRTLQRKLREWLYAVELEQTLGKARILDLYLNLAPWGHRADGRPLCGAEAAAQHHFGVSAQRLTPHQAVTLAAMLHNPQREAARWERDGSVDPARLRWIAHQVRGVNHLEQRALVQALEL